MNTLDISTTDVLDVARQSAERGGSVAMDLFRTDLDVDTKRDKTDVVTRADNEAQEAAVAEIEAAYPDAVIVGEEDDQQQAVPEEGMAWLVDPIDGTNNYVTGNRRWATSIACVVDGEPIAAVNRMPALGDTYVGTADGVRRNGVPCAVSDRVDPEAFRVAPIIWWPRDRRDEYAAASEAILTRFGDMLRFGSAQATLSMVAAGGIEGAVTNVEANTWDTVAGGAMVEWAGGTVTDLDGEEWHHDSRGIVASNGVAHDVVLDAARELDEVREI
ncbi:myo-inositol-1(or 4)-monophosphatase [Halovenus aranensis]|uniref:fructose-bisphosphatase n=1 Tax=Halovenus aranensis TaxID=890420 RepID=A0A1G8YG76_9EURY|nr:inositol monophosphatase [Halovenus aranensis]SDK01703.1 myo-inositol-1(or 4)-monophosphatase [Halovenus aranensis]